MTPELRILRPAGDCGSIVIQDVTASGPDGYGGSNVALSAITKVVIKRKAPNGTLLAWSATSVPRDTQVRICESGWKSPIDLESDCHCCPQDCGPDCDGDDGCYEYTYQVFAGDVLAGESSQRILQHCFTQKRLRKAAQRLGIDCGITHVSPDAEWKHLQWITAWESYQELVDDLSPDCSCNAGQFKRIGNLLTAIGL